jgi:hypothetical protein
MATRTTTSSTSGFDGDSTSNFGSDFPSSFGGGSPSSFGSGSDRGNNFSTIGSGSGSSTFGLDAMTSFEIAYIVYLVLFAIYLAAHLWRYNQTKARSHLLMSGAIFLGVISFALLIAGSEISNLYLLYVGLMLIVVCLWMLRFIAAFLLITW